MSANLPTWFIEQYNNNVQLLVQQRVSRLRNAVTIGTYKGTQASPVDQVGVLEMNEVTGRFEPMPRSDAPLDRRWVSPLDADLAQLCDTFDKLRVANDPMSGETQAAAAAANRKWDDRILVGFFATAATGVRGQTAVTFPSTQVVSVNTGGTDSKLNVAKLEEGRRILMANEVNLEEEAIWVCVSSKDENSLRSEIQIISLDFNDKPVFNDKGLIMSWRGFNFIHSERPSITTEGTDDQSGSSRAVPMWVKSGMHAGIWDDINSNISQRHDLRGEPWQIYTKLSVNATRLEEKKIVKIWCGG
jgi:hypothetical protein